MEAAIRKGTSHLWYLIFKVTPDKQTLRSPPPNPWRDLEAKYCPRKTEQAKEEGVQLVIDLDAEPTPEVPYRKRDQKE